VLLYLFIPQSPGFIVGGVVVLAHDFDRSDNSADSMVLILVRLTLLTSMECR
jgi:hypothetical protein